MKKKLLLLFVAAFFLLQQNFAQQVTVTGKVTSVEDGTPMAGASVKIKGKNLGITTNSDGFYSIKAAPGQTLVFSYIGATPVERTVGSSHEINVQLQQGARTLNEIAVTAFGIRQNVRSLGFSTQNVKAKEVVESQQPNIVNALQGKVAGVQITNSSGAPGASASIMIRGGNSLSGNNQPLFVVDGIPIDNSTPVGQGGLLASYGPATNRAVDINPDDIATITVLKGPAAAALYGIRAASGAIVITTKKGSGGAARVTYQGTLSFDNVNKLPSLQSKYKQGINGVFDTTQYVSWGSEFTKDDIIYDNLKDFFKTAFTQSHDISVSGSSERTNYYASGSLFDQGAITDNQEFKRQSFRVNADTKVGDKLTISTSANYIHTNRKYVPQGGSGVMGVYYWPRNNNMKDYLDSSGDQKLLAPGAPDNPYWSIQNKPITDQINRIILVGNLSYDPFSFLNISYRLGTDYYNDNFEAIDMPSPSHSFGGTINQTLSNNQITTSTLIATLKKDVGSDFHFSLALGHNLENSHYQGTTSSAFNFVDPSFPSINNTIAVNRSVSEYLSRRRIIGLFGDFNFNWKEMIYLDLRGRNDWSSTLPVADNSFFYPAISASAIVTDLLKSAGLKKNDHIFSYAKIRAAYSQVGKDAPPHVLTTSLETVTNDFTINPRGFISNVYSFGDPSLKPEFTKAFETGADLRFIDNRFGIDFTYFRSQSGNQILQTRVPPSSGAWFTYLNGGSIRNQGVEVVLNAQPIVSRNFRWSIEVNYAANTSIVKALPGLLTQVELSDASVNGNAEASAFLGGTLFGIRGTAWKRDAAGQLLLDDKGNPQVTDYTNIGDRNPDYTMGITNTFNYRNFSLSFMVDIRKGGKVFDATETSLVYAGLSTKTQDRGTKVFDGIIESTGAKSTIAVPLDEDYYQTIYAANGYNFVEDGGWTRLRYASLTYTVPPKNLGKIKGLSFTVTGRNLILITKYSGVDPEVSGSGAGVGGSGSFGFDNLGIPATKGMDFGAKLTF